MFKKERLTISIMGETGVGKTALVVQCCSGFFPVSGYEPTISNWYAKCCEVDKKQYWLDLLDIDDSESTVMTEMHTRVSHGFVLVYSITSLNSFQYIRELRDKILSIKEEPQVPIVLVGNKVDEEDKREITTEQGNVLALEMNCTFFETSAKTNFNINNVFLDIARQYASLQPTQQQPQQQAGKKRSECILL